MINYLSADHLSGGVSRSHLMTNYDKVAAVPHVSVLESTEKPG